MPAGTRFASATASSIEPSSRSSAFSWPEALREPSEPRELLQTSSANPPVWCAGVISSGRISHRSTATPRRAICQAASEPAKPPPATRTRGPVMPGRRPAYSPASSESAWLDVIPRSDLATKSHPSLLQV